MGFQVGVHLLQRELQVLDAGAVKLYVVVPQPLSNGRLVFPRQRQHFGVEVHPDHPAGGADQLRRDVTNLAGAGAQVEYRVARPHKQRGVAAAVISLQDLGRDKLQVARVAAGRTTKRQLFGAGSLAVALPHRLFRIQ